MEGYDHSTYGDRIASIYDDLYEQTLDKAAAVQFLADLVASGSALELGIGTGRIALPLGDQGVDVSGIDASSEMIDRLRAKPGGADLNVTLGDFATFRLDRRFDLIYVVFNTLFNLASQEEQVRCFETVAAHLTDRGAFVVEAFVPDHTYYDRGQRVSVDELSLDEVRLSAMRHDRAAQTFRGHHVEMGPSGVRTYPLSGRYAYPSELDLMARLAGMRLRERWEDFRRRPYVSSSDTHVSVYDKLPA